MPAVIHSDQGQEVENNLMQELCLLCGAHKTRTTPYHPASDGLVERFNRRWTEACQLPNKTALAVADAFFQLIVCRFGMPAVMHSEQGRELENMN